MLGNLGLDISLGPLSSLPAWGTEVVVSSSTFRPGGAVANTALALAGLASSSGLKLEDLEATAATGLVLSSPATSITIFSVVGSDAHGRSLVKQLRAAGVDTSGVSPLPQLPTSVGLALVHPSGERAFVTDLGALVGADDAWVSTWIDKPSGPGYFLLTGACLLPGLPPARMAELFRRMRARDLRTALDTGWATDNWQPQTVAGWRAVLADTDLFLPNELEAEALTGTGDPQAAAEALRTLCGGTVVVKIGARGALVADRRGVRHIPTEPREVADSTGAGDLLNAGLLYGLSLGWTIDDAVALGHRLAGCVLENRRTYFPSVAELVGC